MQLYQDSDNSFYVASDGNNIYKFKFKLRKMKTNKQILEEIRVDHAGERGAIKIYEGQFTCIKNIQKNDKLKKKIEEMKEHEREHFEYFDNEIKKKKYCAN